MPEFLTTSDGHRIAYKKTTGSGPTLIWCGGLKSDMEGTKAVHLEAWAKSNGRAYIRFDYFGHGQSSGDFIDGTLSRWSADIGTIHQQICGGSVILVGSSMGGWAALLAALDHPETIAGLVLIILRQILPRNSQWQVGAKRRLKHWKMMESYMNHQAMMNPMPIPKP